MKDAVFARSQLLRNHDGECRRIDPDERAVEECVEIRPQQKAIIDLVRVRSEVGKDMRCLEDVEDVAASNGAPSPIRVDQRIAECSLTAALRNRAQDFLAGVDDAA